MTEKKETDYNISFTGNFQVSVHKQRIVVPHEFRSQFPSPPPPDKEGRQDGVAIATFFPGKGLPRILLYPVDIYRKKVQELKAGEARLRFLLEQFTLLSTSAQVFEGPGRFKLNPEQLKLTGIKEKAVLLGEHQFISIWSPEVYQKKLASILKLVEQEEYDITDLLLS